MAGKYLLATLGCKVNQYESQHIRETLESYGLQPARHGDVPDVAVVNTCAVTACASRKSRQIIRRVARGGRTKVLVVGCAATADGEHLRNLPGVAAVLGHDVDIGVELSRLLMDYPQADPGCAPTHRFPSPEANRHRPEPDNRNDEWMMTRAAERREQTAQAEIYSDNNNAITPLPLVKAGGTFATRIESFSGHQRAFLKVQDGCDAYCSYCIIPRLRPGVRSKPIEVAVAEARDLVRAGHKEIIVTGIFLGAYGRETALRRRWKGQRSPLAALVEALARIDGLARLRLSSLEPGDVDEELLEVLATCHACVPHLHLPLQSGSPEILRRMNRQYTTDAFVEMTDRVRAALDRPAITTDIIVGFPGETEEDFQASLDVARYAEFCKIHAFSFSPRDGTAAGRWKDQFVDRSAIRDRMQRLAEVERECSLSFRRRLIGRVERVIVEQPHALDATPTDHHYVRHGRSDRYFEIHFETGGPYGGPCGDQYDGIRAGDLVHVRIDRVTPTRTHGKLIKST